MCGSQEYSYQSSTPKIDFLKVKGLRHHFKDILWSIGED